MILQSLMVSNLEASVASQLSLERVQKVQLQVWKAQQLQVNFHLVPDSISHNFAIGEHVKIESLAPTFAASQSFPEQVHCLAPQSQTVVWAVVSHIPSLFQSKAKSSEVVEAADFPSRTAYLFQEFLVP